MTEQATFLDNNATTRPHAEVVEAVSEFLGPSFGNPSSAHSGGEMARRAIEDARAAVADLVGAASEQVVFTSSGTEANNMALLSGCEAGGVNGLITSRIEHSSVLSMAAHLESRGMAVHYLEAQESGAIDVGAAVDSIRAKRPGLVSLQWVNNETGVIQPVEVVRDACIDLGIRFHTDAAQAVGKIPVDFEAQQFDFLTLTAHKIHGPPGIGAIVAKDPTRLERVVFGGGQEFGLRAGTENLPGIIGFGIAAKLRRQRLAEVTRHLADLRDRFESRMLAQFPWITVNGDSVRRVCNTTNLRFANLDGQALVAQFDRAGVLCSQSSACTNMRPEPSYVLRAMGLDEEAAYASVRFSFGEDNTPTEVDHALSRIMPIIDNLHMLLAS